MMNYSRSEGRGGAEGVRKAPGPERAVAECARPGPTLPLFHFIPFLFFYEPTGAGRDSGEWQTGRIMPEPVTHMPTRAPHIAGPACLAAWLRPAPTADSSSSFSCPRGGDGPKPRPAVSMLYVTVFSDWFLLLCRVVFFLFFFFANWPRTQGSANFPPDIKARSH